MQLCTHTEDVLNTIYFTKISEIKAQTNQTCRSYKKQLPA